MHLHRVADQTLKGRARYWSGQSVYVKVKVNMRTGQWSENFQP